MMLHILVLVCQQRMQTENFCCALHISTLAIRQRRQTSICAKHFSVVHGVGADMLEHIILLLLCLQCVFRPERTDSRTVSKCHLMLAQSLSEQCY